MKVICIACPFWAASAWAPVSAWWVEQEQNIRAGEVLALEVRRLGAAALYPHTNARFFQGAAVDTVRLEGDLEMLRRCDAVVMAPRWERAPRAQAEGVEAGRVGLPVFSTLSEVAAFVGG